MPIIGYKYSIIVPKFNKLKSAIRHSIMLVLLYFFSPLKYSFNEVIVVEYVVIMLKSIITANNRLKYGEMLNDISAKGKSALAISGFAIKHKIPSKIKTLNISDVKKLTLFCSFKDKLLPDLIIINDAKNTFCDAYSTVKKGSGKMLFMPKVIDWIESILNPEFIIMQNIISGTNMLDIFDKKLKEILIIKPEKIKTHKNAIQKFIFGK